MDVVIPAFMSGLTESLLRSEYLEELLTDAEIEKRHSLSTGTVRRLRNKWGIQALLKSDRHPKFEWSPRLKSLLLGSLLGDARLFSTGSCTAALSEHHSIKQVDYLLWKASLWGSRVKSIRDVVKHSDTKDHHGKILRLHAGRDLFPYWKSVYPTGKRDKAFYDLDLSDADAFTLAVWYMDDGCKSSNGYPRFSITPNVQSHEALFKLLRGFDLTPVLHDADGDPAIWLHDRSSVSKFLDLVTPHIPPSMSYKFEMVPRSRGEAPRHVLSEAKLTEYVTKGVSLAWITQATGISMTSVRRALEKYRLVLTPAQTSLRWSEAKDIIESLSDDSSVVDVLETLSMPEVSSREACERDFHNLKARTLAKIEEGLVHGGGRVGQVICDTLFRYRYEATNGTKPSMREAWFNREWLHKAVTFQRKVGGPVHPSNVFRALKALLTAPSNFRPVVAKKLVEVFCPPGGLVLDPCAGYGGRAVGTLAAGRAYCGVDPHPSAKEAFERLKDFLQEPLDFRNCPFEEVDLGDLQADLVFTSPPYFSVERYSMDSKQSWVRYPTWDLWVDRFLKVLLAKSFNALRPGGRMLLNVADSRSQGKPFSLVSTSIALAKACGFEHEDTLRLLLGQFGKHKREEPILVFRKDGGTCLVPYVPVPKGQVVRDSYGTGVDLLTEDALNQLYLHELKTDAEIAAIYQVSDVLISQQRKRYGIPTLSSRQRLEKLSGTTSLDSLTEDSLREMSLRMSDVAIAQIYSTSKVTIRNYRKRFGILR